MANFHDCIRATCDAFDATAAGLYGPGRTRHIAFARFAAIGLLRKYTTLSQTEIGNRLNRDHTSIMHAERRCNELTVHSDDFRSRLDRAKRSLGDFAPMHGRDGEFYRHNHFSEEDQ